MRLSTQCTALVFVALLSLGISRTSQACAAFLHNDCDLDGESDTAHGGTDCDDTDNTINTGATEMCDSVDNNCDGNIDESTASDASTWYADVDGDTYGDSTSTTSACSVPSGYVSDDTDCDDTNADVHPGATEICSDALNSDCSSNSETATLYFDSDGDGYGDLDNSLFVVCDQVIPSGYLGNSTDCDDTDAQINLQGIEICGDDIDQDCDGADTACPEETVWYIDADGDGYGNAAVSQTALTQPAGYVTDDTDCNDADALAYPSGTEICDDGVDQDCDGADNLSTASWYADADLDGYGDPSTSLTQCLQPSGYIVDNTDCDDGSSAINTSGTETCGDGIDQNCDGSDETCPVTTETNCSDSVDDDSDSTVDCDDSDCASDTACAITTSSTGTSSGSSSSGCSLNENQKSNTFETLVLLFGAVIVFGAKSLLTIVNTK